MFYYKVNYWDAIDQKSRCESGILAAKTYGEAADRLVSYYGASEISDVYLCEWEDVLTEDEIMEGFEELDVKD